MPAATLDAVGRGTASSFTGKELESNQVVNGQWAPLDTLSADDQALGR